MKRKLSRNPLKDTDNDLQSPNAKDSRPPPALANPSVRKNLARDFEDHDHHSSDEDSVQILSDEETREEDNISFYDEAERLPVYKKLSVGLSSLELVKLIVDQDFDHSKICKVKPVAVQHNVTFLIDLKHVQLKDLGADDNGAWEISCPKQKFHIFREDGRITSIRQTKDRGEGIITLRRQYGHHKATKKEKNVIFTRIISSALNEKGVAFPFAVVQVCFHIHIFLECEAVRSFFLARTQKFTEYCLNEFLMHLSRAISGSKARSRKR